MKIIHYSEAEARYIDTPSASKVTGRVVIGQSDGAQRFCMRVFELGANGHTPLHTHEWEHEIFVQSGEGKVWRGGDWVDIRTGSVIFVPPGEEHQMKNTGESPLTFVCLIPAGIPEI
jgi:quercetin dioxygenase-like cupin family protein